MKKYLKWFFPMGILLYIDEPTGPTAEEVTAFQESIPEDLRSQANIGTFKSVGDLAKSYAEAQRMVGQERLPKPQENWTDDQWAEHYKALGRPEDPTAYPDASVALNDGITINDEMVKGAKSAFHGLGLTDKQALGVLNFYYEQTNSQVGEAVSAAQVQMSQAMESLQTEWGAKYDENLAMAQSAVNTFGGEDLLKTLEDAGFANNPALIKTFAKIGAMVKEDAATGQGGGLLPTDAGNAAAEMNQLRQDTEFMNAYLDDRNPGHKGAVERMLALQRLVTKDTGS